jgi:hypothetical protein
MRIYSYINLSQNLKVHILGIPMNLVRMVKMTLANTNSKVKIQGKLSPSFETAIGL